MKSIAVAACLLFATSLMQAQTAPAAKPADAAKPSDITIPSAKPTDPKAPAAPGTAATKAAPDKKGTAAKAAPAKKEEKKEPELPKIPGTVINRPNGTFLGLEVVGGNFKLTFYDKKHKPMTVDVTRATARWPNPKAPGDNRTVLNGTGTELVGQKAVVPPFNFNVFLTLLQGEGDEAKAVENYTVPFKG